jgi:hypothetical protein
LTPGSPSTRKTTSREGRDVTGRLLAAIRQAFSLEKLLSYLASAVVALVVGAVVGVVAHLRLAYLTPLAIALFLLLVAGWLAVVRWRRPPGAPPQKTFSSPGAPGELVVFIDREEWHPFQFKALILEARVRIRNRSSTHMRRLRRRAEPQIYEPGQGTPDFAFMTDIDVSREVHRLEDQRGPWPRTVEPRQTVHGWYVLSLPHRPQGGEPSYEIVVSDELGHEYGVRRLARPK